MTFLQRISYPSRLLWSAIGASLASGLMVLGGGIGAAAVAADSLTVRWGQLSQTVDFDELDKFAQTGEVSPSLRLYRPLLTPALQASLQSEITIDPVLGLVILDEMLATHGGTQLLDTLQALVPNLDVIDIRAALDQVAESRQPLTLMSLLRQLPQDTLELNLGALLSLASQAKLAQMENAALSRVLRKELAQTPIRQVPADLVDPFSTGPFPVERWELVLRDRSRERNIPVDIYWSEQTRGPLVLISHGFGADRRFFAYLAKHLASHGLTVVSVEHPGSNVSSLVSLPSETEEVTINGSRILPATEFLDRPRDITYVLDRMEKLNVYSYSLRDRLNTEQVTLIGHSLGGYTGLALAGAPLDLRQLDQTCQQLNPVQLSPSDWLQCAALDLPVKYANLKDNRITQLIVTNPLTGQLFGETGLSRVTVPTLILASTHDNVTPIAPQQLEPFTQLAGPKYLITAIGGSHLSVGDPDNLNADLRYIPFMPELPDATSSQLRIFLQGTSLSFIMQQTPSADTYAGFLNPSYAQAFSTSDLPLGFNLTLPDSLTTWPRLQKQPSYTGLAYWPMGHR
ncbi:MAG: alpha/beta fold hydrolase [Leptolyngbyaceae cyanobacterium SM2_5_2]|nr:alpha/beta fold hydrolase [Leptolyngbyaceae cyanobacterium SM2_5_2]